MIQPLDWPQLVAETIRRRKQEGLTQQAHADLAGVSKPVIIAFDKGETTLSLGRALSILNVVGLVQEGPAPGSHAAFIAAARARWQELIAPLPPDAPARHSLGGYQVDYEIRGDLQKVGEKELLPLLPQLTVRLTGWGSFWAPTRDGISPQILADGIIECWIGRLGEKLFLNEPAYTDFWRISSAGQAFLERGFKEDDSDTPAPGRVFDIQLPIWRLTEALLHARNLAENLTKGQAEIHFSARYRGLAFRELISWGGTGSSMPPGTYRSLADTVDLSVTASITQIVQNLPDVIHELVTPLYERFDGFRVPKELVDREVADLLRRVS
ncbi:hypothetical protein [Niveispirillum sp. KHB5.9]|uniref:hypothetical protein n=1 Tax=Niveispirillum sp. KHB5.9 TaxID=3400269 RepID=UPI003A8396CE